MNQCEGLTAIGQLASIDAVHANGGIAVGEGGGVVHQDKEMARSQERAHREGVADAVGKVEATELEVGGRHVFQFEELKLVTAQIGCARRMIHDLCEQQ